MNERLRELMLAAGYAAPELAGRAQKLAELIVNECANEILKWKSEPFPYDPEFGARLIKEHFGVEE